MLGAHTGAWRMDRDRAYSEALSDALAAAVVRLLENSDFTATLGTPEPEEP